MQRFFGVSQDASGNAIPSVTVTVNLASTGTAATLYSDNAFTPLANPLTSNTDGTYQFYARNGRYDVVLTKTSFTFTASETTDVLLDDEFSVISPAQITSSQNDYDPTNAKNASVWRLTSDASSRVITGILAGNSQQLVTLVNAGSFNITLSNESALSTAANRIVSASGFNVVMTPDDTAILRYDATTARWRVISEIGSAIVKVLDRQVTTVTAENAVGPTTVYTFTVPGGTLGTSRTLRMGWTADILANNAPGDNYTITIRYGATTICSDSVAPANSANRYRAQGLTSVAAHNATGAQVSSTSLFISGATTDGVGQPISATLSAGAGHPSVAEDSTADKAIDIRVSWNAASLNNSFRLLNVLMELL